MPKRVRARRRLVAMTSPTPPRRFRFGLRTLFVAVTAAAVMITALRWWTKPYAITRTWMIGGMVEERWQRRTITGAIVPLRTTRFYPNGQKAQEFSASGTIEFWLPDGTPVGDTQFFEYHSESNNRPTFQELANCEPDP